ncbi:hypothetical protein JCM17960_00380 [Magnetospira thiophila]
MIRRARTTPWMGLLPVVLGALLLVILPRPDTSPEEQAPTENEMVPPPSPMTLRHVTIPAPPPVPLPALAPVLPAPVEVQVVAPLAPTAPEPRHPQLQQAEKPVESAVVTLPKEDLQEGRVALRFLEHGQGPVIELAWPEDPTARVRLYDHLSHCIGMSTVLMNAEGLVFDKQTGPTGRLPDLDRYSGFVRQVEGLQPPREARLIQDLRRAHAGRSELIPVRLFPRAQDAQLLGGLTRLVGKGYAIAQHIHARYRLEGRSLLLLDIQVDGQRRSGVLRLPASSCHRKGT